MKAEIISVGTELLLGHTINSDAALVARELASLGISVRNQQTVGDNPEKLREALALAASRADIIITTGGLGPTDDDLTKSVIAGFAGVGLELDEPSLGRLKEYFGSREMSPSQMRQAYLPAGCEPFPNDVGTAPGCALRLSDGKRILMLPGPPRELVPMLESRARPYLLALSGSAIHSSFVRVFGMGEGAAAELAGDLMAASNPTVAPYAHSGEMFFKVTARAASAAEAREAVAPVAGELARRLGDVVYGIDVDSLEQLAVRSLAARGETVAVAESCTGGLLASRITGVPGASDVFHLGLVTYSNDAKERLLGVPHALIAGHGAVSHEVAEAMANNVRGIAGADYGIGISGIAGPGGGSPEKPVGLVYIALASASGCQIRRMWPEGRVQSRAWIRERAASHALDMLRRRLAGLPEAPGWK